MPDKVLPGPIHGNAPCVKEAVCIHTNRIYDSCRDKECIENIRVYPTRCSQEILDCATSVKSRDKIPYSTKNGVHDSCTEGVLITNWTIIKKSKRQLSLS